MDVYKTAFVVDVILPNRKALAYEKLSYIGGITQVMGTRGRLLIGFDINSSYPCAMCNLMPWRHITHAERASGFRYTETPMTKEEQDDYVDHDYVAFID